MSWFAEAFHPRMSASSTWGPTDDRWYTDSITGYVAERGDIGIGITAETMLRCGTVLAAVRFRGDCPAMCPPSTYIKTENGRQEDPTHYSQLVLRNPNLWQTGNRWRHLQGVWMATWGNAFNEIIRGPASFADELRPLSPARTRVVDQRSDGSLVYLLERNGLEPERKLGQEKILHFRDISTDGMSGLPMYQLIRNVVGIALLAEKHAATFLRKGNRSAGFLIPNKPLEKDQKAELRSGVNADVGGSNNTGQWAVLPYGVDIKEAGSTNRDAQFMELTDQTVGAILRFLGVPGVVVGFMGDKTATYASAKEFFESGGIKHCVLPILVNMEAEEEKALLVRGDNRQIKHNLDVLLRANTPDRFAALAQAVGGPWMSRNEARRIEDLNKIDDPEMDSILTPVNLTTDAGGGTPAGSAGGDGTPGRPPFLPKPDEDEDDEEEQEAAAAVAPALPPAAPAPPLLLAQYAHDNALRVVRRELRTLQAKAPALARNTAGWRAFVLETYEKHGDHVAEVMRIPPDKARAYCDKQMAELLARGVGAAANWEKDVPPRLAALALEGPC